MIDGLDHARYPKAAFRNPEEEKFLHRAWEQRDDSAFKGVAVDRIKTDFLSTVETWVARYPKLWLGTRSDQFAFNVSRGSLAWTAIKAFLYALNISTLVLGALGIWVCRELRAYSIPVLYAALIYVPFHNTETRYTLFAFPFLYLFIAGLLIRVSSTCSGWRKARQISDRDSDSPVRRLPELELVR